MGLVVLTIAVALVTMPAPIAAVVLARPVLLADDRPDDRGRDAVPYSAGLATTAVGQLASADTACTATVIPSRSGRIALTAAHCVYADERFPPLSGVTRPDGFIEDLTFYPGRRGDQAPAGNWPVTRIWVDPSFLDDPTPADDIAFLELADQAGATAQDTLGAQGIAFHALHPAATAAGSESRPSLATGTAADGEPVRQTGAESRGNGADVGAVTVLGYPVQPPFDGTQLHRCTAASTASFPDGYGQFSALRCDMTGGSSGGPWLARFDPATGAGVVVAVSSFSTLETPGLIGAAPLGEAAAKLLAAADTGALNPTTRSTPSGTEPTTATSPTPAVAPTWTRPPAPTPTPSGPPSPKPGSKSRSASPTPARPAPPARSAPQPTAAPTFTGIPFPVAPPSVYRG